MLTLQGKRMKQLKISTISVATLAGGVCLLVFLRALTCDFINLDDHLYVTENTAIRVLDWVFVRESFTTAYMGWWMPLTWLSFAIDYQVWGLNPFGYHLTNVLLHAANTFLVVLVADLLCRDAFRAGSPGEMRVQSIYSGMLLLAGLMFAVHPLRVESVVWVTERKDVLNGIFSLGAIYCYLKYVQSREAGVTGSKVLRYYLLSLALLLLSLMAKPVSVVIPVMLLVADWYPLCRLRKGNILPLLIEKIPFFMVVVSISALTVYLAAGNQILVSYKSFTLPWRLIQAGNALFEYIWLSIYPVKAIVLYLLPRTFPVSYYIKTAVVCMGFCWIVCYRKKYPVLMAAWCTFLLPLLPVLGFFQNGAQSYAARFTYLPSVAPSIAVAAILCFFYQRFTAEYPRRAMQIVFASLIVALPVFYGAITVQHIGAWKNPETLWSRVIAIQPAGRIFYYRADYRLNSGRYLDAAEDLSISIKMGEAAGYPEVFNLYALRGDALNKAGRYGEAIKDFTAAISLQEQPNYYYHRGVALQALGKTDEAEDDFLRAGQETGPIEWVGSLQN